MPAAINGFEVEADGEVAGLGLGNYGEALLTLRRKTAGDELWLFCPADWRDHIEWRVLLAEAAAVAKNDDRGSGYARGRIVPPARYILPAAASDALRQALRWAEDFDGENRNAEHMLLIAGEHGHFVLERDEEVGAYRVRCDYGRQAPLKNLGAQFDQTTKAWIVPYEAEEKLQAVLTKAAKGVRKMHAKAESDRKHPLPQVDGVTVKQVERGFEVAFDYNAELVGFIREIRTAKWQADRKVWTIGTAGYGKLREFLQLAPAALRKAAEERAAEEAIRQAEREAQKARWAVEKAEQERQWAASKAARAEQRQREAAEQAEAARAAGILQWYVESRGRSWNPDGQVMIVEGKAYRVLSHRPERSESSFSYPGLGCRPEMDGQWIVGLRLRPDDSEEGRLLLRATQAADDHNRVKLKAERMLSDLARACLDRGELVPIENLPTAVHEMGFAGWGPLAHRAHERLCSRDGALWLAWDFNDFMETAYRVIRDPDMAGRHDDARSVLTGGVSQESATVEAWVYSDPSEPGAD